MSYGMNTRYPIEAEIGYLRYIPVAGLQGDLLLGLWLTGEIAAVMRGSKDSRIGDSRISDSGSVMSDQ